MDYLEHYLDMVASIEATAAKLNIPVRIEGYEPPGITAWKDWWYRPIPVSLK